MQYIGLNIVGVSFLFLQLSEANPTLQQAALLVQWTQEPQHLHMVVLSSSKSLGLWLVQGERKHGWEVPS